jgi:hypothetical protein
MLSKLPSPMVKARQKKCGNCDCKVDFWSPCASCPKGKWSPQLCEMTPSEIEIERAFQQKHELPFPNIREMALNFATAVKSEIKSKVGKENQLTLEEIQKRYSICESCEYFHSASKRCRKCGCFLKWKTAWKSQACPINKW